MSAAAEAGSGQGPWYVGLGFGPSRGVVVPQESGGGEIWVTGAAPQIRFGRFVGDHFAIGVESQGWFGEFGSAGNDLPLQLKLRLSAHLWALTATVFPASDGGTLPGLFLSLGGGPAISNLAGVLADPRDPDGGREIQARLDEWGWGVFGTVGYEFSVTRSFSVGLQLTTNHLTIEDELVRRVWFGGPEMHVAWYF